MYELEKKIGKVFTSKFVGIGPSSYEKKNLPGRSLTKAEKHWSIAFSQWLEKESFKLYTKCLSLMCFEVVLRP